MTPSSFFGLGATILLVAPPLLAQEPESQAQSTAFAVHEGTRVWKESNGSNWHTYTDVQTGYVQFLYGGSAAAAFQPADTEDFYALGRLAIESTETLHGIESATLVEDSTHVLPLSRVGTTDKVTAQFRQEVNGVPVLGGFVNTLFTTEGELLSVQTTAMPDLLGISTGALVGADRATTIALKHFEEKVGLAGTVVSGPTKAIGQLETGPKSREARLVWQISVHWYAKNVTPEGYTLWVDAYNGSVINEQTDICHFDVGGTLSTMASPGTKPDIASNPETQQPMNHARVNGGSAGTVYTDANGNFNFPGVTGPINITVDYYGLFTNVNHDTGTDYTLTTSVTGTGNSVLMNPSSAALVTAQANAHLWIGKQRDWVRSVDPSDSHLDFRATANVNLNDTCNAYFNGSSINHYKAGGSCPNTSYSTVVLHEMGHWHNVNYNTGNGSDGMGEGNADIWAMYVVDNPIVGENFTGTGYVRSGMNTRQFCGDSNPGCYGGVHADGEVWMGAAWKVRRNLNLTLGNAAGDAVADALFINWMNAYNQTQIKSVIETQWLTLDDDDGNIDNGTPNYNDINDGFLEQGFPGYDLALIEITGVTELPDTLDEVGPYTVDATVVPLVAPSITGVELLYNVDGGNFVTVPMSPVSGDDYTADIPGQISPARVEYYVRATDSLGNEDTSPKGAPDSTYSFRIGLLTLLFSDDFEGGTNGWTHGQIATQDDWQLGVPQGQSGDPSSAYSGSNVWGNDLGPSGWNGEYKPNVSNWLRSPVINCSSAVGTTLSFRRWLTVEEGIYDQAKIKVNGAVVWQNPSSGNLIDTAWTLQEVDIANWADGNSSVQIEFTLETDGGVEFGGWNIDDLEVFVFGSSSGCIPPVKYGTNKENSLGWIAQMAWVGTPSETSGDFEIGMNGGIPDQFALLFSGGSSASVPFYGGFRLVGNPLTREAFVQLDMWGSTMVPMAVDPGSSGSKQYFQFWYRDPAHVDGTSVGLSDGLEVLYCD